MLYTITNARPGQNVNIEGRWRQTSLHNGSIELDDKQRDYLESLGLVLAPFRKGNGASGETVPSVDADAEQRIKEQRAAAEQANAAAQRVGAEQPKRRGRPPKQVTQ